MNAGQAGVSMEETPLDQQAWRFLQRLRTSLPCPVTAHDCYFGCMPLVVREMYRKGVFDAEGPLPGRNHNMLQTMFATFAAQSTKSNPLVGQAALHVSVESQEEFLEACMGRRGHEKVFWFHAPSNVPLPRNSYQTPFFLPGDHPEYMKIRDWVDEAFKLHNQIDRAMDCFQKLARMEFTASMLRAKWPRVMNFMRFKRNVTMPDFKSRKSIGDIGSVISQYDLEEIITLLTTASMLPEKQLRLKAWVGFNVGNNTNGT